MSRFIYACSDIHIVDSGTGEPTGVTINWEKAMRVVFQDERIRNAFDIFDLIDLRKKLIGLVYGGPATEISDEFCKRIVDVLNKPTMFGPAFIYSTDAEAFFRAFSDAASKPRVESPKEVAMNATNGMA